MARRDYKEFAIGEIHHAFNRGNDKMDIFRDSDDYIFFLSRLQEALYPLAGSTDHGAHGRPRYQGQRIRKALPPDSFSLIAYCLMPNHFHLLILQKSDLPISALMLKVLTSYSKYFNKKYDRVGSLFQDQYKTTHIGDNTQLLHTSAYIHNNPRTDGLTEIPESYPYSSFQEYVGKNNGSPTLSESERVLEQFSGTEVYWQFVYESFEVTKRNKE
jgi:putative transposase